jgi:pimeloyl-ACP methyl ester carboxylesterase
MSARVNVDGVEDRVVLAGPREASEAVVFVHGNPGSADDWERLAGACGEQGLRAVAPDMPDFGETVAPTGFEHTVAGYATFLEHALSTLGVQRAHLVLHDFGGPFGLVWAAAHPEQLASVTLIDTGILPGYRWHRMARIWRTPVVGELSQALMFRSGFRRVLAAAEPKGLPREFMDRMYDQYDSRTRKAVLKLYRSADDPGAAGAEFAAWMAPREVPALVIWGQKDSYLPCSYAERQREAFPTAEVHVLQDSGHWPFVDAAETVERLLLEFLGHAAKRLNGE